jgi:hypothetical protein
MKAPVVSVGFMRGVSYSIVFHRGLAESKEWKRTRATVAFKRKHLLQQDGPMGRRLVSNRNVQASDGTLERTFTTLLVV